MARFRFRKRRPFVRRKRIYRRLKRYTRRNKRPRITQVLSRTLLHPDRLFVKLKDVRFGTISSLTLSKAQFTLSGNSIYNTYSNTPGAAHPTGWLQYTSLYNNDCVFGSKIKVTFCHGEGTQPFILCGIWPSTSNNTTTVSTTVDYESQPYDRHKYMGAPTAGCNNVKMVKNYMTTKKMFARKNILESDDFWESTSNAPQNFNRWYWNIYAQDLTTSGSLDNIRFVYEIVYYVCFINKRDVPFNSI